MELRFFAMLAIDTTRLATEALGQDDRRRMLFKHRATTFEARGLPCV